MIKFMPFIVFVLIIYTIPNIYLFFRLKKLLISKKYFMPYIIAFTIYYLLVPSILLMRYFFELDFIEKIFDFSYYALAYLLYIFIIVLIIDILLLINLILKVISKDIIKTKIFKIVFISLIIIIPSSLLAVGSYNYHNIKINKYNIEINKKSSKLNDLKIALVADFHIDRTTNIEKVKKFVKMTNDLKLDALFLVGDIIEHREKYEQLAKFENIFSQLKTKYGVFAVLGNHEKNRINHEQKFFINANINLLNDETRFIDSSFNIIGRIDSRQDNRLSFDELYNKINNNYPTILLDHRPIEYDIVSKHDIDIMLSGHTHNGQLFPFNYIVSMVYDLNWGHLKIDKTNFFVTSGIQAWGPKIRTVGDSEIMLINVKLK